VACDGYAVVGHIRPAEGLAQHGVPPARAERDLDGVGELVDAGLDRLAGLLIELNLFGHGSPHLSWPRRRPGGANGRPAGTGKCCAAAPGTSRDAPGAADTGSTCARWARRTRFSPTTASTSRADRMR